MGRKRRSVVRRVLVPNKQMRGRRRVRHGGGPRGSRRKDGGLMVEGIERGTVGVCVCVWGLAG